MAVTSWFCATCWVGYLTERIQIVWVWMGDNRSFSGKAPKEVVGEPKVFRIKRLLSLGLALFAAQEVMVDDL